MLEGFLRLYARNDAWLTDNNCIKLKLCIKHHYFSLDLFNADVAIEFISTTVLRRLYSFLSCFIAERCNRIASSAIPIRCLSMTRVYCDKTAEARIMQFSLKCIPMP